MPTPQQELQQLFTDAEHLIQMAIPILEAEYAFAQVVGHILIATNQTSGPPPTYYIGDEADWPSSPAAQQTEQDPGPQVLQVFNVNGTSGGMQLKDDGSVQVYAGQYIIASSNTTHATGANVINTNPSIASGAGGHPIAGEGAATSYGLLFPSDDTSVYMMAPYTDPLDPNKHMYVTCGGAGTNYQPNTQFPWMVYDQFPEVQEHFTWVGVSYPGTPFPAKDSLAEGVTKMASLIASQRGTFAIGGYSFGAVVSCRVWRDYILNPEGDLHDRLGDIIGHLSWGNPMRCPTFANGNALANLPIPGARDGYATGGIAGPQDLTPWQTMPWHIDFAHEGDLYTDCPTGLDPWSNEAPPGELETSMYKLVAESTITGQDSLLLEIGKMLTNPIGEIVPLIEALINGIQFLSNMNTHNDYGDTLQAAADWLSARGAQVPVRKT